MSKLTKINFKISIPDEFELDEKKYLISSVKETFPSEYPKQVVGKESIIIDISEGSDIEKLIVFVHPFVSVISAL